MKTNTFKYFGLALMAVLMVSFTSCEVEIDLSLIHIYLFSMKRSKKMGCRLFSAR